MRKKILLVDDSTTVLMAERMMLGEDRFELRTARDGAEAIASATAEPPDLILMDVVMPKLDGLSACRALRQAASTRSVPIILVTTRGGPDDVEAGYACGCSDYINKPIDGLELLAKVESLLGELA